MRLAIVCDWLTTYGGAEHVLAELHVLWPDAPIVTTVSAKGGTRFLSGSADVRTDTFLQRLYAIIGKHQPLLPLMPKAVERIDLDAFDVIVSSSHAVGKGIIPSPRSVHICYCHTPMRYGWEMEDQYLDDFGLRGALRRLAKRELRKLRRWDLSTAKRVDSFIANSTETQRRIQSIYGRESVVIPPPVDARFFEHPLSPHPVPHLSMPVSHHSDISVTDHKSGKVRDTPLHRGGEGPGVRAAYFLALGRLVPYKRFDLLIELANLLRLPLKIGGKGSEEERLRRMAGPTVEFLGFVPDADLPALYGGAQALLSPQMEDAGIVPMEAQAMGVPVVAYGKGGILDIIEDEQTGILATAQTVGAFSEALKRFWNLRWDRQRIRSRAERFHAKGFRERIETEVRKATERFGVQSVHA